MEETLNKLFNNYGALTELEKLKEDAEEYIEAYDNYINNPTEANLLALYSETADLYVPSAQLKQNVPEVNEQVEYKINRQLDRIESGE